MQNAARRLALVIAKAFGILVEMLLTAHAATIELPRRSVHRRRWQSLSGQPTSYAGFADDSPHVMTAGTNVHRGHIEGTQHFVSAQTRRTAGRCAPAALALAAGLLLLPACSANNPTSSGASSPGALSPSSGTSATVKAVRFDETYRTDDGLSVQITEIENRKLGQFPKTEDPDAKEGDPYVWLGIRMKNGTKAKVTIVPSAALKFGPDRTPAAQVAVVDELDAVVDLEPNEVKDYYFGFIIPRESYDQVVMELTMTIDPLRTAAFSGSIKPT